MGNCFGRSSKSGNFSGEGRALGSSSAPNYGTSGRNASSKPKVTGPGRTLGSGEGGSSQGGQRESPREAARRAAEEREQQQKNQPRGKLGRELEAQKKQTRTQTLEETSRDNAAARDAEANRQNLAYN